MYKATAPPQESVATTAYPLHALLNLQSAPQPHAVLFVAARPEQGRIAVHTPRSLNALHSLAPHGWWATPAPRFASLPEVGDSPQCLHPLFIAAALTTEAAPGRNVLNPAKLRSVPIPWVRFETAEEVRRSMTLNGMRMTTEYMQSGSQRVLELVNNRLLLGQRDVVHDIAVYVMRQIEDLRAEGAEARWVRADSIAAYLGLEGHRVRPLFAGGRLAAGRIAAALEGGAAGPLRRKLDVPALVEGQCRLLQPELRELRLRETSLLRLLDEIMMPLRGSDTPGPNGSAGL